MAIKSTKKAKKIMLPPLTKVGAFVSIKRMKNPIDGFAFVTLSNTISILGLCNHYIRIE